MATTQEQKEYMLSYYYAHRERIIQYQHKYYKDHKEQIQERQRNFRRKHADKNRAYYRKYYLKNRDRILNQQKNYIQQIFGETVRHKKYASYYQIVKDGEIIKTCMTLDEVSEFIGFCKTTVCKYIRLNIEYLGYSIKPIYEGENENEN